jgi:prepilin-type N-terminal cleavage/methylation domain-containing protein
MRRSEAGFTLIEIMVAVTILSIGVAALLGSSALVTRMVSDGKFATHAAVVAERRLDILRTAAARTAPGCTHASFASGTFTTDRVSEAWTVTVNGESANIREIVSYQTRRTTHADTLYTTVPCY